MHPLQYSAVECSTLHCSAVQCIQCFPLFCITDALFSTLLRCQFLHFPGWVWISDRCRWTKVKMSSAPAQAPWSSLDCLEEQRIRTMIGAKSDTTTSHSLGQGPLSSLSPSSFLTLYRIIALILNLSIILPIISTMMIITLTYPHDYPHLHHNP